MTWWQWTAVIVGACIVATALICAIAGCNGSDDERDEK